MTVELSSWLLFEVSCFYYLERFNLDDISSFLNKELINLLFEVDDSIGDYEGLLYTDDSISFPGLFCFLLKNYALASSSWVNLVQ